MIYQLILLRKSIDLAQGINTENNSVLIPFFVFHFENAINTEVNYV